MASCLVDLLNPDSVEDSRGGGRVGIGNAGCAAEADDVAADAGEGWLRGEIGAALEVIGSAVDALPFDSNRARVRGGERCHDGEDGSGVRWIRASDPFLPVIHPIAICVG